jgi:hypothetical protein
MEYVIFTLIFVITISLFGVLFTYKARTINQDFLRNIIVIICFGLILYMILFIISI